MDFIKTMFRINRVYATAFLIALITLLVYLSALQNGFVSWDDDVYVYENLNIRTIDCNLFKWVFSIKANPTWHPLTLLSLALDYSFWELNPLGYHLTNIVLHAVNTFLVFTLAYRLISLRACQFTAHGSRCCRPSSPPSSSGSIPSMWSRWPGYPRGRMCSARSFFFCPSSHILNMPVSLNSRLPTPDAQRLTHSPSSSSFWPS